MKQTYFELTVFALIVFEFCFIRNGFKKNPGLLDGRKIRQGYEAIDFMIIEPWRTKYRWGGIVQVILVILTFLFK